VVASSEDEPEAVKMMGCLGHMKNLILVKQMAIFGLGLKIPLVIDSHYVVTLVGCER
jgi:hypothetical protein